MKDIELKYVGNTGTFNADSFSSSMESLSSAIATNASTSFRSSGGVSVGGEW